MCCDLLGSHSPSICSGPISNYGHPPEFRPLRMTWKIVDIVFGHPLKDICQLSTCDPNLFYSFCPTYFFTSPVLSASCGWRFPRIVTSIFGRSDQYNPIGCIICFCLYQIHASN
jgi:hypothetical protein